MFLLSIIFVAADQLINFTASTPADLNYSSNENIIINISIKDTNLSDFTYSFKGINNTLFGSHLIAWYNFDNRSSLGENNTYVVDLSGHNNYVYPINTAVLSTTGKYCGSASFDGTNDIWRINNSVDNKMNSSSFTWSMWFNFTDNTTASNYADGLVGQRTEVNRFFLIIFLNGSNIGKANIFFYNSSGGGNGFTTDTAAFSEANIWYHIAVTYNETTDLAVIYKNGNKIYQTKLNLVGGINTNPITTTNLGFTLATANNYLKGKMDDVMFYDIALPSSSIMEIYKMQFTKYDAENYTFTTSNNLRKALKYEYQGFITNTSGSTNNTEKRCWGYCIPDNVSYSNNITGRYEWLSDATPAEMAQIYTRQEDKTISNFEDTVINYIFVSGNRGRENITIYNGSVTGQCVQGNYCLNVTYNLSETNQRVVQKFNIFADMSESSGFLMAVKGDNTANIFNIRPVMQDGLDNIEVGWHSLNYSGWIYYYIDFGQIRNNSGNITRSIDRNKVQTQNLLKFNIVLQNETGNTEYDALHPNINTNISTIFIDDIRAVDYDNGMVWRNWNGLDYVADSRYNEGMYNLAMQYLTGKSEFFQNNSDVLNSTLEMMDTLVIFQLDDGGWGEYDLDITSSDAGVGFPMYSFMKSLVLLKDNSRLQDNVTLYHNHNISTNTRQWFYNDTAERAANWTLTHTFPRTPHWFANQYIIRQNSVWLYYNYSQNSIYLSAVSNELSTVNQSWQLNKFGFIPERNISGSIGADGGYYGVGMETLALFYYDSRLPILSEIINKTDKFLLNTAGKPNNHSINLSNSSRGSDYQNGLVRSFVCNTANELNNTYTLQYSANSLPIWSQYGDIIEGRQPYRSTFIFVEDYRQWDQTCFSDQGFKWPLSYSYYSYNLFNETAWTRRKYNMTSVITNKTQLEFPEIFYAYDNTTDGYIKNNFIVNYDSSATMNMSLIYPLNPVFSNGSLTHGSYINKSNSIIIIPSNNKIKITR